MNECMNEKMHSRELIYFLFLMRKYAYNISTMIDNFFFVELEANVSKDKT